MRRICAQGERTPCAAFLAVNRERARVVLDDDQFEFEFGAGAVRTVERSIHC